MSAQNRTLPSTEAEEELKKKFETDVQNIIFLERNKGEIWIPRTKRVCGKFKYTFLGCNSTSNCYFIEDSNSGLEYIIWLDRDDIRA